MKRHIPNFLTCCSLFSGCFALVQISNGNLPWVPYLVWIAAFFDFIDGFAARLLKVSSPMGKELDSLSDMVSFGVVPGYFVYALLQTQTDSQWLPFIGFAITIGSALRLAKFNIDERQSDQFIGLPTPANAIFLTGLIWLPESWQLLMTTNFLIAMAVLFSILLNAEIPLIALKFKDYKWSSNVSRYFVILSTLALMIFLGLQGISLAIVSYLCISIVFNFAKSKE
ncbi:MAG: CDP-diacylglycerol--serine O-phosphatidyltransferase [Cyclobacteriaceae bacterium]